MSMDGHGVIHGGYICNQDRNNEINTRIYDRNIPSQQLQAQFSPRSVSTKYALLPIVDSYVIPTVPIIRRPTYNINETFNPGNDEGPWSGYAAKINDDSRLKNIFFARQDCGQAFYIPDSTSDMYKSQVQESQVQQTQVQQTQVQQTQIASQYVHQPYPDLFATPELAPFNPNPYGFGYNTFDNCTRQQVKSVDIHTKCV